MVVNMSLLLWFTDTSVIPKHCNRNVPNLRFYAKVLQFIHVHLGINQNKTNSKHYTTPKNYVVYWRIMSKMKKNYTLVSQIRLAIITSTSRTL